MLLERMATERKDPPTEEVMISIVGMGEPPVLL